MPDDETDIVLLTEMPDDVYAILRGYVPSNTSDDAVHVLRETYRYLPADGRRNLAQDILEAGAQGKLKQLAQSIVTGLLTPLKAAGIKTPAVTPSPRIGPEDSIEGLATIIDESIRRGPQQQLRDAALQRDGNRCVIYHEYDVSKENDYPNEVTALLGTAHIIPFALAKFANETERQRMISIWVNLRRYFPSIRSRLNFHYDQINSMTNVMTLSDLLHSQFGRFTLTLEATETLNQYRLKTFRGFSKNCILHFPADGIVTLTAHDERYPLPSPDLLQLHCAVANILHATGRGVQLDRILHDYGATGVLARDGSTNISELLPVKLLPTIDERSMNSKSRGAISCDTRKIPALGTETDESKENS